MNVIFNQIFHFLQYYYDSYPLCKLNKEILEDLQERITDFDELIDEMLQEVADKNLQNLCYVAKILFLLRSDIMQVEIEIEHLVKVLRFLKFNNINKKKCNNVIYIEDQNFITILKKIIDLLRKISVIHKKKFCKKKIRLALSYVDCIDKAIQKIGISIKEFESNVLVIINQLQIIKNASFDLRNMLEDLIFQFDFSECD